MYPELKDLQIAFKRHLMERAPEVIDYIASTDVLNNEMRLAIYGNAYYARLMEALESDYEALHTLLGDEEFSGLCEEYIDTYPSRHPSLRWFGRYMSRFLASHSRYEVHPYLSELALFEWTFIEAFDAEDMPVATETDAAKIPAEQWPQLRIQLHPSVHWFAYRWNILPVWKAATNEDAVPEFVELDDTGHCVVWRQKLTTQYRSMDMLEALVLRCVKENKNFAQICEVLSELDIDPEQVPMQAASIFKTWLAQSMITGFLFD